MADLQYGCADNGDGTSQFTWAWTNVPTDDREPGLDNYFVRVVVLEDSTEHPGWYASEEIGWYPGAEDNAWGEPYTLTVPNGVDLYVQVINDAKGFRFEDDEIVTCQTTEVSSMTVTGPQGTELPYTGGGDWMLPLAITAAGLIALGSRLVRLGRK